MRIQEEESAATRSKIASIAALTAVSVIILLSGVGLGVFSIVNNVRFPIMSYQIHGAVWGAIIAFLGIRYLFPSGS